MTEKFEYLIYPFSKEIFFKDYFEKNYLLIQNRASDYYKNVLNIQNIDEAFLTGHISAHNISFVNKEVLTHDSWTSIETFKGFTLDYEKINKNLNDGHSMVINALNLSIPKLKRFADALKQELLTHLWANIYITPPSKQAFKRHYDTHDVFVLQIKGQKGWKLFETPLKYPHATQKYHTLDVDYEKMETIKEFSLNEGDLLYIP